MSSEWYQIRSTDVDSSTLRYTQLLNKINIGQFSASKSEAIKRPKILAETTESKVVYQDPFYLARRHGLYTQHELPTEPNATTLRVWWRFAYVNDKFDDMAMMENHGRLDGLPLLCPGYNDGVIGLFLASKFNYDLDNHDDYVRLPINDTINLANMSTGFSFTVMFKPLSFNQNYDKNQTLVEFLAASDGTEWAALRYSPDHELEFFVKDGASTYDVITPINSLMTRAFYAVTVTYDPLATPRQHVYSNLYELPDVTTRSPDIPVGESTDLLVGIRSSKDAGQCNSIFQEFKMHSRAISFQEHLNNWYNLRTTDSIKFGGFAHPGYWFLRSDTIPTPDFDPADFDSNDFA
jgi:hypothetical protein